MSSETRLLAEIIRCVPSDSIWHISNDSWKGIKDTFGQLLFDTSSDWQIRITDQNRTTVALKAEEEVAEKVVHMDIESNKGEVLFVSYDAMASIKMNVRFYNKLNPVNIPADLEIGLD